MPNKKSLYHKHPDYRVDLEPNPTRVRVELDGEVIAKSDKTLLVRETRHDPVIYFPPSDVDFEKLTATDLETFCPFKGDASYWTVTTANRREENAVWAYCDPFDEVAGLKDYVSFYADRFDWIEGE